MTSGTKHHVRACLTVSLQSVVWRPNHLSLQCAVEARFHRAFLQTELLRFLSKRETFVSKPLSAFTFHHRVLSTTHQEQTRIWRTVPGTLASYSWWDCLATSSLYTALFPACRVPMPGGATWVWHPASHFVWSSLYGWNQVHLSTVPDTVTSLQLAGLPTTSVYTALLPACRVPVSGRTGWATSGVWHRSLLTLPVRVVVLNHRCMCAKLCHRNNAYDSYSQIREPNSR